MIGNDIISRRVIREHPRSGNERYVKRVLTGQELEHFKNAADQELFLWISWALKESAYKVSYKENHHRFFAPKKFECRLSTRQTPSAARPSDLIFDHEISTPTGTYEGAVRITDAFIHALVIKDTSSLRRLYLEEVPLPTDDPEDQSTLVDDFLLKRIATALQLPPDQLELLNTRGYPFVQDKAGGQMVEVSTSHHGEWGGICYLGMA